ncbi:flagellar hook-length control protein FliK [Bacillus glycinifermentans]|uniref:flagellar hook-length control protein FliK n=1 Tax=Bacillus glycinifermentans TaxID=1664069 RepID=UPI001FF36F58|nr:flagellar hook-length control protein FliK [Bacillus glycinifermentans]UOY89024.1 flagellar hook-length control protein FliK [Bacillus glycinifermentans]
MKLLDMISFDGAPPAQTSGNYGKTSAGTLFQSVLQKENLSFSGNAQGMTQNADNLNELLQKIKDLLSGTSAGELDDKLLKALEALIGQGAKDQETVSLAEELLKKIAALLQQSAAPAAGLEDVNSSEPADESDGDEAKSNSPDRDALATIQHLLYTLVYEQQPLEKSAQISSILEKGPEFLEMLKNKGAAPELIDELKRQIFTKDPDQSKLLSMSKAELKSFQSVIDQMMKNTADTGQKEWKMAESELKAFLLGKKTDVQVTGKPFFVLPKDDRPKADEKPAPFHQQSLGVQQKSESFLLKASQAAPSGDPASSQSKAFTDQILGSWKQMKYTPFGKSTGSFTIRLNPENLGFITVKLIKQHGMFSSKIIASTQSAKELLEHNLAQLKQALPSMSVQIDRFSVPLQTGDQQQFGQPADDQGRQQQPKQDSRSQQEGEDFREFLEELIESRTHDYEEEI